MMKVIIADDEAKVALLIKNLIGWEELGMELAGIAKNGSEALDMIRRYDPDIVITDIRMPVKGGLELISEAKEIKPALEFVIISGYRHFDYAHSAIKFGVSDYLLKPVNQKELLSTLEKLKGKILSRSSALYEQERMLQIESDRERGKRAALFRTIREPDNSTPLTVESLNENLGYRFTKKSCFRFMILKIDRISAEEYAEGMTVFHEKIREILLKKLSPLCDDLETEAVHSRTNIVLGFPPERKLLLRDALKEMFDEIRIDSNIFPSAVFTLVGGAIADNPSGLTDSWGSAEWGLSERLMGGAGSFYENHPVRDGARGSAAVVTTVARRLEQAMDVMDVAAVDLALSEAFESMRALDGLTGKDVLHIVKSVYDEWLILCQRYNIAFPGSEGPRLEFNRKLDDLASVAEVFAFLRDAILECLKASIENHGKISGRPISRTKEYIKEHFHENISISDLADREGFNDSYFSTLFKKETGQTFSEYLTSVRMDEAKRLLKETNLPIARICEAVGYSDMKHFSVIFRKSAGIKPSEYRKLYSWGR